MTSFISKLVKQAKESLFNKNKNNKFSADSGTNPTEIVKGFCLVCGNNSNFVSYEPVDFPCKRNSFTCNACQSNARNRHLAKIILELYPTEPLSRALSDFSSLGKIKIFNASANGAIHSFLSRVEGYEGSEFVEDVPSGAYVNGIQCQDIQDTSFQDGTFELVITEDVLEHVPDPKKACDEIKRILRPGGWHVSTIPVLFHLDKSVSRAIVEKGKVHHLLPPEYHLDPCRPEGVLVFTDFGKDLVDVYLKRIGKTIVYESHKNKADEENYAIYNNWIYASQKV